MRAAGGEFEPNDEVDELRWLPPAEAAGALHARPRPAGARRPGAHRRARASPRCCWCGTPAPAAASDWDGPDELRPLDERGIDAGPPAGRGAPAVRPDRGAVGRPGAVPADGRPAGRAARPAGRRRARARRGGVPGRSRRPAWSVVRAAAGAAGRAGRHGRLQPGRRDPVGAHGAGRRSGRGTPALSRRRRRAASGRSAAGPGRSPPTTTATSTPTRTPRSADSDRTGQRLRQPRRARASNASMSSRCRSVRPTSSSPSSSRQRV